MRHCPSKDGAGVMKVLDKQLDRIGLSRYDVVAMTGDGGAENEGLVQGMHATLEADVPGYVRKRCLGHFGVASCRRCHCRDTGVHESEESVRVRRQWCDMGAYASSGGHACAREWAGAFR